MNHTKTDVFARRPQEFSKKVSKIFFWGLCALFLQHALVAMGQKDDSDVVKLSFMSNSNVEHPTADVFRSIIAKFEAENPDISITFIPSTGKHPETLRTKMAANDLPDLWTTHGWSVNRYSEYLRPLNDQPWFPLIHQQIRSVITDKDGQVFVLPMNRDVAGIVYSKTLFDEIGINAETITSWDALFATMQQIKDYGITPVHIGGKDPWTIGNFMDWVAPSVLITDEQNNERENLLNGTFNNEKWVIISNFLQTMLDKGFLNKDVNTSSYNETAEALATKEAALVFLGNNVISEAKTYNPDIEYGFFPVPAYYEGDTPTFISGERMAVGVYKDTPYEEQALRFLSYLAKPENIRAISESDSVPAGLTNTDFNLGELNVYFEKYKDVRAFNYFDREWLPSGMWGSIKSTGAALVAGTMSPEQTAEKMAQEFQKLYK